MNRAFPGAVPEIPVGAMDAAVDYYRDCLGFDVDWRDDGSGISGVSRGACRLFLTDAAFRA
ncbi:MAG: bleomycin resistance family protein, partial [Lysobacter sp.]|nr:bleomycin resistance family protein [Lysobacter sp.]